MIDAFPDDTAPAGYTETKTASYGAVFQRRVAGMGIAEIIAAPASPWQNGNVERSHGIVD